eukprot:Skav213882  [mRNA]  locus=scaffold2374:189964:192765:- [translate_table: standard]
MPDVFPTSKFLAHKSRSNMLPVIHGESAKVQNEGRGQLPRSTGPLSEILSAVSKDPLPMQRSVRRPQTINRPSRGPASLQSNLRGVVLGSSTLTSFLSKTSSHKSLVPDVKESRVLANGVMMPLPRFVSVRRSGSRSRARPELPEALDSQTKEMLGSQLEGSSESAKIAKAVSLAIPRSLGVLSDDI